MPRLVFARLSAPDADEVRFRVALYALQGGNVSARAVAEALRVTERAAERALEFWTGAGLLEKEQPPAAETLPARHRLTSADVAKAAEGNATLGALANELQRLFGGVVSQSDINIFATLYLADGFAPDTILLAASHFASKGITSARYIEKTLLSWRREGICDAASIDRYLKLLAEREGREAEVAALLGVPENGFTLAERRRMAEWFEDYGYNLAMVRAAMLTAGEHSADVRYLAGILKRWHAKGYKTERDVQRAEGENRNVRVQGARSAVAPENDLMVRASLSARRTREEDT